MTSYLGNELSTRAAEAELFPLLVGNVVCEFHDVHSRIVDGQEVISFIHRVQGHGSPDRNTARIVEAHIGDRFFYIEADSIERTGEYPDEDYVLEVAVGSYMIGEHSFSEALTADIDRRETRFSSNE